MPYSSNVQAGVHRTTRLLVCLAALAVALLVAVALGTSAAPGQPADQGQPTWHAFAQTAQLRLNLTAVGSIGDTPSLELNGAWGTEVFHIDGRTYAIVAGHLDDGVQILDLTDPSDIRPTYQIDDNHSLALQHTHGVATFQIDGRTYVAVTSTKDAGVQILDLTDPYNVTATDKITDTDRLALQNSRGVDIFKINGSTYAAVTGQNDAGVQILNVTDPHHVTAAGQILDNDSLVLFGARDIATFQVDNRTYAVVVAMNEHGAQILDLTDPYNVTAAGQIRYDHSNKLHRPMDVDTFQIDGSTYAAVASLRNDGVQILDLTDPHHVTAAGHIVDTRLLELDAPYALDTFQIYGHAYVAVAAHDDHGMQILNVTDPHHVTAAGYVRDDYTLKLAGAHGIDVFQTGGHTYVAVAPYWDNGLQIIRIGEPIEASEELEYSIYFGPRQLDRIILSSTTPGTIQATWTAPTDIPDSYRVSWAKVGESFLTKTDRTGNAFPIEPFRIITGLEEGETYMVKVRPRYWDSGGLGDWSNIFNVTVAGSPSNYPPVADAGPDQTVLEGVALTLNGTVSDPDPGDRLTYSWSHDSILDITLANQTALSTTFTAPQVDSNATIAFTLTAGDPHNATASDTMTVTVLDVPDSSIPPPSNNTVVLEPDGTPGSHDIGRITLTSSAAGIIQAVWEEPDEEPANYRVMWAKVGEPYLTWTDSAGNAFPTVPSQTITGLEAGAEYKLKVRASYGGTPGDWSGEIIITMPSADPANGPPTASAGPDRTVSEGSTVSLNGTASDPDGDFLTYAWSHDPAAPTAWFSNLTSPSATFMAPRVGSNSTITLTLTASDGAGTASDSLNVTVVATPEPPRGQYDIGRVTVSSAAPGTIQASWEEPDEEPANYRVSWARVGQPYPTWTDLTGNAFPAYPFQAITGLEEGAEYKLKVRASYDGTAGDWSEVTITAAGSAANTPAAGSPAITGTARVGQTLTANTTGITDADGMTNSILSYQWISNDGTTDADISGAATSSHVLAAGDEGRAIKVRVAFTDDSGHAESLTSAATQAVAPAHTAPGSPQNLAVSTSSSGTLAVSWQAPASDGGSSITGYAVQWKTASGSWTVPADVTEAATTGTAHTITGLTDGTPYAVRVLATNGIGDGEPTPEETATPQAPAPPLGPRDIGVINLASAEPETIRASWEAPSEEPVNYRVMWAKVGEPYLTWTDSAGNAFPTAPSHTITGLAEGVEYKLKVRASYDGTAGDWSGEATVTVASSTTNTATIPGSPQNLAVSTNGSGTLAVSWQAPASNGGSNITGYAVQWKESTGSWDSSSDVTEATSTGTSHTITGLTDGTPYAVRVLATNGIGDGEPTPEETATPQAPAPPLGPRDIGVITLSSTTPGTIHASWDAPGEEPANYRVMWAKAGEPYLTWTDSAGNAFPTAPSHTITGLAEGVEYKLKVRASYDGTAGDWSGETTITVARTG